MGVDSASPAPLQQAMAGGLDLAQVLLVEAGAGSAATSLETLAIEVMSLTVKEGVCSVIGEMRKAVLVEEETGRWQCSEELGVVGQLRCPLGEEGRSWTAMQAGRHLYPCQEQG